MTASETNTGGSIKRGVALAFVAAGLFGVTAPLLQKASVGASPLFSGSLLYLGAALGAGLRVVPRSGGHNQGSARALLAPPSLLRLLMVALVGAALAPALLVRGLGRTDAATASLLLALEAPFTLLLAWLFMREHIGGRVLFAALAIFAGGAALVVGSLRADNAGWSAGLVAAAAFAWAVDNLLSRPLADHDPVLVVVGKGIMGGTASGVVALLAGQTPPSPGAALALLLLGAVSFGVSLQFYLRAQKIVGVGRTASVFGVSPFIGVVAAVALGAPWPGVQLPIAAGLIGLGLWLHLSERHAHRHQHEAIEHEHWHRHDDGHHDHQHDPMPSDAHSHPHHHDAIAHAHEHSEDLHHRHPH
ncbi:MAG TPA: DMT family transporter [Polyangia bacterium]|jgi:drug/metabolite transporter (DMT)-like permease|nr:DMT family transporter [Polyangia bacterium]